MKKHEHIFLLLMIALPVIIAQVLISCTAGQEKVVNTILDVSDAICDELPKQDEPDWVKFTCTAVDIASGVHSTFMAKVKKEDAPTFAARRCNREGSVAP